MTETKFPFTKKISNKIPADQLSPGTKGVELEIQTNFNMSSLVSGLDKCAGGPVVDGPFEKIAFIFKGDEEKAYYDMLMDSNKKDFELSFDQDKIFWNVAGFDNFIDKTKPEISISPGHKSMCIFLESKFAGIITLESREREREREREMTQMTRTINNPLRKTLLI